MTTYKVVHQSGKWLGLTETLAIWLDVALTDEAGQENQVSSCTYLREGFAARGALPPLLPDERRLRRRFLLCRVFVLLALVCLLLDELLVRVTNRRLRRRQLRRSRYRRRLCY